MTVPAWFWISSPLKFFLWLFNRMATWTGSFVLWKRRRSTRRFLIGMIVLNMVSIGILGFIFFWLHTHAIR